MQLRIAFTGAHSTGKNTLLAACKASLGEAVYSIDGIPRSLINKGIPMGKEATIESFLAYHREQSQAEHSIPAGAPVAISNRTCIDSFAYATANSTLRLPSALPETSRELLKRMALQNATFYRFHVYFPIEFPGDPDPMRP